MGTDISGILEKRVISLEELGGKKLAIDGFNTLYQFLTIIRQPDGTPLMDSKGRITSHMSGLFYRTCNLLEKGIKPVFVFDGKPSELKQRTLRERAAAKREAQLEMLEAVKKGDVERAGLLAQRTARLTDVEVKQSKELLDAMGIPWLQAPSEGEAQCAFLASQGLCHAAASQDYDTLLFGAPLLVRNLTLAGKRKMRGKLIEVKSEEIDLHANLQRLGINREKLIWIGILAGTDFNEGIYGIGSKKALKLVEKHSSFAGVLKEIGKEIEWQEVYELFEKPLVEKVGEDKLKQREMDRERVVRLMVDEYEFSIERVDNSLKKAFKEPDEAGQAQLKKWF